jgi:glucuronate isomerase
MKDSYMIDLIYKDLYDEIMKLPVFDAHTHVDADHLAARGLHDILLYHMLITELYSAGCPDSERLSEEPDEEEVTRRIERALPYLPYIENTSCFWICKRILKDLYGWEERITKENWRRLHDIIRTKYTAPSWPRQIMAKANVEKLSTEYWRRKDGRANDILEFALEWAFFDRCQWQDQYDIALVELEVTWDKHSPGSPLPVTITGELNIPRRLKTLDDVHEAMNHYCDIIPYDEIVCVNQNFSTDVRYRPVSADEMSAALKRRGEAGPEERDIYICYLQEYLLVELEKRRSRVVVPMGIAAEPLPFESGTKFRDDSVFDYARMVYRHPKIEFVAFIASASHNQHFCTLCRELPNLYLIGYWWHNFFPSYIYKIMKERLEMLPVNKNIGFFTDGYCLDWVYGKSILIRRIMSDVLGEKIAAGYSTESPALDIAKALLQDTGTSVFRRDGK